MKPWRYLSVIASLIIYQILFICYRVEYLPSSVGRIDINEFTFSLLPMLILAVFSFIFLLNIYREFVKDMEDAE